MKPALFQMDQLSIENLNERMLDAIDSFPTLLSFCHGCLNNVRWLNLIVFLSFWGTDGKEIQTEIARPYS